MRSPSPARAASFLAFALLAVPSLAHADDRYFEAPREAREAACEGGKYICYDLLSTHKQNYFLTGFDGGTQVKFQLSVKYNLWPNESPSSVHLAYSQKSKWDIYRPSAPFDETNYNPEIFYTYELRAHGHVVAQTPDTLAETGGQSVVDQDASGSDVNAAAKTGLDDRTHCAVSYARGGAEHESNGLGGTTSRGWNRIYVESFAGCDLTRTTYGVLGLKVWAPPFAVSNNPDISKYLGSGDLTIAIGAHSGKWYGAAEVEVVLRKGWRVPIRYGSLETNIRWHLGDESASSKFRFAPYFFAQWFTGYGETLLDYDNPTSSFRVGIGTTGSVRLSK